MALENLPLHVIGRVVKHRTVADTSLAPHSQPFVGDFISRDSKHNVSVEELRVDGSCDEVKIQFAILVRLLFAGPLQFKARPSINISAELFSVPTLGGTFHWKPFDTGLSPMRFLFS